MPPEQRQQELTWALELYNARRRFVSMVESVTQSRLNAKKRKEVYLRWRDEYGVIAARSWANYAEAVLAGEVSLEPIKAMIQQPPNPKDYE